MFVARDPDLFTAQGEGLLILMTAEDHRKKLGVSSVDCPGQAGISFSFFSYFINAEINSIQILPGQSGI